MTEFTMGRESLYKLLSWLRYSSTKTIRELSKLSEGDLSGTAIRSFHKHGLNRDDVMEILEHLESSSDDSWVIKLKQGSISWQVLPLPETLESPVQTVEEVAESALKDKEDYEKRIEELETELDWTRENYVEAETAFWECFDEGIKAEESMRWTIESLENRLTEAREARKEWKDIASELARDNMTYDRELEKLKEVNESLSETLDDYIKDSASTDKQLKEALKETAGLSNEIGRLKETCKGWESLYEDCLDERIELEEMNTGLAKALDEALEGLDDANMEISKMGIEADFNKELFQDALDYADELRSALDAAIGTASQEPTQTELFNAAEYADKQPLTVSIKVDGKVLAQRISKDTPLKSAAETYDTAGPTTLNELISPEVMQAYINKVILPSFRWQVPRNI